MCSAPPPPASLVPGCRGLTLLELLFALAVGAVLLAAGVPALERLSLDARRTADVNAFVTAVQLARSEAAKRGRVIVVCGSADSSTCTPDYSAGWLVFVDEDGRPGRAADEPLLFAYRATIEGTISSNRALYEFRPFRRRSTNGTVTFCDRRGAAAARAVIVSYTGRPRVSATGPGRPLSCA